MKGKLTSILTAVVLATFFFTMGSLNAKVDLISTAHARAANPNSAVVIETLQSNGQYVKRLTDARNGVVCFGPMNGANWSCASSRL